MFNHNKLLSYEEFNSFVINKKVKGSIGGIKGTTASSSGINGISNGTKVMLSGSVKTVVELTKHSKG